MKNKMRFLGYLLFLLMGVYVLGLYTSLTVNNIKEVEPHRWVMTSIVTLYALFEVITSKNKE